MSYPGLQGQRVEPNNETADAKAMAITHLLGGAGVTWARLGGLQLPHKIPISPVLLRPCKPEPLKLTKRGPCKLAAKASS